MILEDYFPDAGIVKSENVHYGEILKAVHSALNMPVIYLYNSCVVNLMQGPGWKRFETQTSEPVTVAPLSDINR